MKEKIQSIIRHSIEVKTALLDMSAEIQSVAELLSAALKEGNKILICGNGGSAADAQHWACELVGRFEKRERKALPVIALSTDTSFLTAWSNDYEFETVFARQVEALGKPGDVLVALSTSGKSPNIIKALEAAERCSMKTVALTGNDGGAVKNMCDKVLIVPARTTPRIQEGHELIYHIICELIEIFLFET